MRLRRSTVLVVLLLACVALAAWQWREYRHECQLACETAAGPADSIMNALVGGIRSHRRLGRFFSEQVQAMLDGLVSSGDVRAVALVSQDGRTMLTAGDRKLLNVVAPCCAGSCWNRNGFQKTAVFRLPPEVGAFAGGRAGGSGRGVGRAATDDETVQGSFAPNSRVTAVLLLDRQRIDQMCRRAAVTRSSTILGGWLVILSIALAWWYSVRLTEAEERTKNLEAETRHLRDLGQAAAGLAHETRNPIGLIRGWTQRLASTSQDPQERCHRTQAIIEECDRLTARINQFLAFARPCDPKPERFDLSELIGDLATLLEPDTHAKQVSIHRPEGPVIVTADREMLREALFNLLQNAVQASPDGGCVETSVVHGHGRLRLDVADRGQGVPQESAARLFTPYFTTKPNGTGLGLAIVRSIAVAHGWTSGYTPRPDGGTIFWIDGIQPVM